jgi:hypothetical protein
LRCPRVRIFPEPRLYLVLSLIVEECRWPRSGGLSRPDASQATQRLVAEEPHPMCRLAHEPSGGRMGDRPSLDIAPAVVGVEDAPRRPQPEVTGYHLRPGRVSSVNSHEQCQTIVCAAAHTAIPVGPHGLGDAPPSGQRRGSLGRAHLPPGACCFRILVLSIPVDLSHDLPQAARLE